MAVNKVELANGEVLMDLTGDSVTPETLAEGETAHDASGVKITGTMKAGGGGTSVQSDWNQTDETAADFIKNKPFGEMYGDTLVFDGNTDGLPNVYEMLFKVSDAIPTYNDIANGGYSIVNGNMTPFSAEDLPESDVVSPDGIIMAGLFAIVPPEMAGVESEYLGMAFPEAGTYFAYSAGMGAFVTELQINGYTEFWGLKKLDRKYLVPTRAALLYSDGTYLHKEVNTSDASTRLTNNELREIVFSGCAIYVSFNDVMLYPADTVRLDSGGGYIAYLDLASGETIFLHTAEYTPSA